MAVTTLEMIHLETPTHILSAIKGTTTPLLCVIMWGLSVIHK